MLAAGDALIAQSSQVPGDRCHRLDGGNSGNSLPVQGPEVSQMREWWLSSSEALRKGPPASLPAAGGSGSGCGCIHQALLPSQPCVSGYMVFSIQEVGSLVFPPRTLGSGLITSEEALESHAGPAPATVCLLVM